MLDIKYVRDNLEAVRAAMESRGADWDGEAFMALAAQRSSLIGQIESRKAERNTSSKRIGELMRAAASDDAASQDKRREAEAAKEQVRALNSEVEEMEAELADALGGGVALGLARLDLADQRASLRCKRYKSLAVPVGLARLHGSTDGFEVVADVFDIEHEGSPLGHRKTEWGRF